MKKNVIKTAVAAVCVVAASMGGMKAYNAANKSEANLLLEENVEALSQNEGYSDCGLAGCHGGPRVCDYFYWIHPGVTCYYK